MSSLSPADLSGTACFYVQATSGPGVMPRVMELFAKRGLVPSQWHSSIGADGDELHIDIQMSGLDAELTEYIAACLRQVVGVSAVLTSEKRSARSA